MKKKIGILLKKLLEEHVKLANMSWDEKERQRKPAKEILDVIGWDMKERIRTDERKSTKKIWAT